MSKPPEILITNLSPGELFAESTAKARKAADEIQWLLVAPIGPTETTLDRALLVAAHARNLSDAWLVIDAIASGHVVDVTDLAHDIMEGGCGECAACKANAADAAAAAARDPRCN